MTITDRVDYNGEGLRREDLASTPLEQITRWLHEARERQEDRGDVPEPSALSVATADANGQPDVRTVLMRLLEPRGVAFFTGLGSAKGLQLAQNQQIAASLTWVAMFRAIRFRGRAVRVEPETVAAYFAERPWASRISAWASQQSHPVVSREAVELAYAEYAERFPDQGQPSDVPVPPHWGGYWIEPFAVECWGGRSNRLHDRWSWRRDDQRPGDLSAAQGWTLVRLQP